MMARVSDVVCFPWDNRPSLGRSGSLHKIAAALPKHPLQSFNPPDLLMTDLMQIRAQYRRTSLASPNQNRQMRNMEEKENYE